MAETSTAPIAEWPANRTSWALTKGATGAGDPDKPAAPRFSFYRGRKALYFSDVLPSVRGGSAATPRMDRLQDRQTMLRLLPAQIAAISLSAPHSAGAAPRRRGFLFLAFAVWSLASAHAANDDQPAAELRLVQDGPQPPDADQARPADAQKVKATPNAPAKPHPIKSAKENPPAAADTKSPASTAPPAAPAPTPSAAGESQPLAHAAQAGVKACLDSLVRDANATIDAPHTAMSQWFNGAGDSHVFQSIVTLTYPNKVLPRAAVVLEGAPTAAHNCDASYVQIFPTARPCNDIQGDLLKGGKVIANMSGLPVTVNAAGARQLLLPGPGGNGCVVVVVGLTFGK